MLKRKNLFVWFLLTIVAFTAYSRENESVLTGNDSTAKEVSQDELILFNMINDMRVQGKMQPIPLSQNLCKVAHCHIDDLIVSKPQDNGCSLHSWSSSGNWTPCCNSKDPAGVQCMKSKPREITGYQGNGFELIYWGEDKATPSDAAALWQQVEASADMILCRGKWKVYQWKALGVGIKDGYAILWLGDKADKTSEIAQEPKSSVSQPLDKQAVAQKTETKESHSSKNNTVAEPGKKQPVSEVSTVPAIAKYTTYYLVVASVKTAESAKSELKRIKSKGYPNASILEGSSVYRIAVAAYDNTQKASQKLNELKKEFPGAWIYKQ